MPSQFFGLYIAGSGLRASNAALNTTANNISNAQTNGYSRQQATQQANNALRTFTTYGCAGAGVDTIAIERVRNNFYDVKYWDNNSKYGEYTAKQYYMRTIEDYFNDDGTSGFKSIFNKFSASLQSVTTNASSDTSKAQFIAAAKSLTDYFNNMYGNLQQLQQDINLEIKQNVDQINSIAQKIATLNKQINVIELSGPTANELRDKRDLLIDELSEIVDVKTTEMKIYDSNNPERETGGTRYVVQIGGGQVLVDGNDYNNLTCEARAANQKVNQSDTDGLYMIRWENGNQFSLTNAAMEGKLKGLVELRDGNNGANFHGTVLDSITATSAAQYKDGWFTVKDDFDGPKYLVSVKVDEDYLRDMKNCDLSDTGGTITIGNKIYEYESWTYDPSTNNYTFVFNEDPKVDAGASVKTSEAIKYQGIPYYMNQMNAWIRGFAEKVNEIFMGGVDSYGNNGCLFFTGNANYSGDVDTMIEISSTTDGFTQLVYTTVETGSQYTEKELMEEEWLKGLGIPFAVGNGYYDLTAGNFTINEELIKDAALLGTRSSVDVGVEECGQIEELISLLTSREKFNFRNGTAGQMLEALLSDVALNASDANTFYNTFTGLRTSIDNQRTSISGVDEDEEAVSLVKFQNSYTLASKMIQTLTEVYDQLILRTGV